MPESSGTLSKLANNQVKNVAEKLLYSKGFFEAISDVKDNK